MQMSKVVTPPHTADSATPDKRSLWIESPVVVFARNATIKLAANPPISAAKGTSEKSIPAIIAAATASPAPLETPVK